MEKKVSSVLARGVLIALGGVLFLNALAVSMASNFNLGILLHVMPPTINYIPLFDKVNYKSTNYFSA